MPKGFPGSRSTHCGKGHPLADGTGCRPCRLALMAARYARITPEARRERKRGRIVPLNAWPGGPRLLTCLGPGCAVKFLSRSKATRLYSICRPIVAAADVWGLGANQERDSPGDRSDLRQHDGSWSAQLRSLSTRRIPLDFRRRD